MYHTFVHILDTFTNVTTLKNAMKPNGESIERQYGQSLFKPVPISRTCKDAGVPDAYCACFIPRHVPLNDSYLIIAAKHAVDRINSFIPKICHSVELDTIVSGGMMEKKTDLEITYIIAFRTNPGNFIFEANVDYFPKENTFATNDNILRMDKINAQHTHCLTSAIGERFCYCL